VDRVADVLALEIDGDVLGDGLGRAHQLDGVAHDVEHAATLEAGALGIVDEVNRHIDAKLGAGADPQEVDMECGVAHRVEVIVAGDHLVLLPIDVEGQHVGKETAGVDAVHRVLVGDRDTDGGLFVAVDDGWDKAFTTQCTSGPLAHPLPRLSLELGCLSHGLLHWVGAALASAKNCAPVLQG
jgi:hypothetical protein